MLFSSIEFLFYFLPVTILVYFIVPQKARNFWLLAVSLFFYAWGEPKYIVLMLLSIGIHYGLGLAIGAARKPGWKRFYLVCSLLIGLGLLGYYKYADFAVENFNALTGMGVPLPHIALPIGISFYTFQILSYTIDVYRGRVEPQRNLVDLGCYVALFPQLIAGPIVRYTDIARELKSRSTSWEDFYLGLRRFLIGLGKKVLLANQLGAFVEIFHASTEQSVLLHWLYAIGFSLHIYFDFSGYSDMAIGLGRIFGFHFPENFNYPYLSSSVQEFWRRWHMTLGSWFRDYLYIPLGGNRVSKAEWLRNVLAVWLLTGLWHGAAWNFVLWGLMFAALLLLEKFVPALQKMPKLLRHGYVLLAVIISFVLFNAPSLSQASAEIAGMFGLAGLPLTSPETNYYLRSYAIVFLAALIGATPLPANLGRRLERTRFAWVLELIFLVLLLGFCTASLVDGSFNPFLYFRF